MSSLASVTPVPSPATHVLLVDDALDNRELYAVFLQQSGYDVSEASYGFEALKRLAEAPPPDLMVTDIVLPDMDGFELCRRMKAQPALQDVPVIAITALPMTDRELARAREAGSSVLLQKPCLPETLLLEIKALLAHGRALQVKAEEARARARALSDRSRVLQERSWELQLDAQRLVEEKVREVLVRGVRAEFQEMPGLLLTVDQARRLWGLEARICELVLGDLVADGFLTRTRDGSFRRHDRP
jgi:two-component system, cell cycle response regulator DivK